jgi:large subunit ribosomal protein L21
LTLGVSVTCLFVRDPLGAASRRPALRAARTPERDRRESESPVYAIVRAGGRQEKVSVGDVIVVDRLAGEPGDSVQLKPLMLVDGDQVTATSGALAGVTVTAEIVAAAKGPKIKILKFKNKTGYRKRQGHRAKLTRIKVTGIEK